MTRRHRICTICARGGSKGVPNKNLRLLCGVPLIAHTIRHAQESRIFDAIAVSSDSPAILEQARVIGIRHLVQRPGALATDCAGKVEAIRHCVEVVEGAAGHRFETVVDLDVTSPLRTLDDVCDAVALLERTAVSSVITGAPARRSPYFNLVERDQESGRVRPCKFDGRAILRRQDAPECFDMNASIYVWQRDALAAKAAVFYPDTLLYAMPPERSLDIDSELDFALVEFLMERQNGR